jgi:hypothetical protein
MLYAMLGLVFLHGIMTDIPTSIIVSVTDLVTHQAMRWLARRSRRRPIDRELVYALRNLMELLHIALTPRQADGSNRTSRWLTWLGWLSWWSRWLVTNCFVVLLESAGDARQNELGVSLPCETAGLPFGRKMAR